MKFTNYYLNICLYFFILFLNNYVSAKETINYKEFYLDQLKEYEDSKIDIDLLFAEYCYFNDDQICYEDENQINTTSNNNEELDIIGTLGRVRVNPDDKMIFYKLKNHRIYKKTKIFTCSKSYSMNNSIILKATLKNVKSILMGKDVGNLSPAENSLEIVKLLKKSNLDSYIK